MNELKKNQRKIANLEELERYCQDLRLLLGEKSVLFLRGRLGAGKTKIVELLLKNFGFTEVSSPTFALHHRYEVKGGFTIDHFDLYRIESEGDLESIGFWDVFARNKGWVIVEWPERLSRDLLSPDWPVIEIEIQVDPDGARMITTG